MARHRAELAAKFLSAFVIADTDKFLKGVIATGSEPMNE